MSRKKPNIGVQNLGEVWAGDINLGIIDMIILFIPMAFNGISQV